MKFIQFIGLKLVLVVLLLSCTKTNIEQFDATNIEGVYKIHTFKIFDEKITLSGNKYLSIKPLEIENTGLISFSSDEEEYVSDVKKATCKFSNEGEIIKIYNLESNIQIGNISNGQLYLCENTDKMKVEIFAENILN